MNKTISTTEARKRLAEIGDNARTKGITYSVVRHGKVMFKITPPDETADVELENDIKAFFKKNKGLLEELAKR